MILIMILILWVISLSLRVTSSGVSTLQKVNNKAIELNNKDGKGLDAENTTKVKKLNKAVGNATKKVISSIRMVVDIIKNILCLIFPAVMLIDIIAFVLIIAVSSSCLLLFSGEGGYISSSGSYIMSSSQGNQSSGNFNTPVGSATGVNIIKEAEKYVGKLPYVWGGVSLETGADCSGFVCAIYEKFGYDLWDSRTDLVTVGSAVSSIDDAQAGDILIYSGHVALYDGNGGRIHAPQTGEMVSHDTNLGNYTAIRRVIDE